jgi:hypothetical protein
MLTRSVELKGLSAVLHPLLAGVHSIDDRRNSLRYVWKRARSESASRAFGHFREKNAYTSSFLLRRILRDTKILARDVFALRSGALALYRFGLVWWTVLWYLRLKTSRLMLEWIGRNTYLDALDPWHSLDALVNHTRRFAWRHVAGTGRFIETDTAL